LAVKGDPVSAFGGIVAFNIEVDEVSCVYRFQVRR
jgi:AICAR transformylase/IMP cyclohydrolase PurH